LEDGSTTPTLHHIVPNIKISNKLQTVKPFSIHVYSRHQNIVLTFVNTQTSAVNCFDLYTNYGFTHKQKNLKMISVIVQHVFKVKFSDIVSNLVLFLCIFNRQHISKPYRLVV